MTSEPGPAGSTATDHEDAVFEAATRWLRALLVPPVSPASKVLEPLVQAPKKRRAWWQRTWRDVEVTGNATALPLVASRDDEFVRRARQDLEVALDGALESRLLHVCGVFGLSEFERDILILLLLHAINTEIARLCSAMPESDLGRPTFALALGLAEDPVWEVLDAAEQHRLTRLTARPTWAALSPERPLRHWRLVEITQPAGQPLVTSPLRLDERIVNYLMGIDYLDDRIAPLCQRQLFAAGRDVLTSSQDAAIARGHRTAQEQLGAVDRSVVQLVGSDAFTRRLFAAHFAEGWGLDLYRVPLDVLSEANVAHDFARLWNRECRLQDLALVVEVPDASALSQHLLTRVLAVLDGLVVVDAPEPLRAALPSVLLDVTRPTHSEQLALWIEALEGGDEQWAERLAGQFDLNAGEIGSALTGTPSSGPAQWHHFRTRGRVQLADLAQRTVSSTGLDDVFLPAEDKRMLEQIRDQARHRATVYDRYGFRRQLARGLGITALFTGESGTGKTMAAEALAGELELDLYRIDLSGVVSKYIGETEKNLKRVFDAAEQSGAVLLFDEADAIFGKRSEVQDNHDRYANIEVSYLLQRMEAYEGLAILTTNMKNALDQAFLRRLRFIVSFPFPGPVERRKIWVGTFSGLDEPARQRLGIDSLDFDALAKPGITGGQIRNIAVNAAFLAAARDGVLTMTLLADAARDELRKSGRPFVAADFAAWTNPQPRRNLPETEEAR